MRDRLGGVARWLADNRAFLIAVCLVALLARYVFDWAPDDRPAPPPRPIAAPTAVATPVPLDIAYPTATPTAAPTASPTVAPTPIAELRGAGQLLYAGRLGGRNGIIASNADGTDRRLLAEGMYRGAIWSPDGRRFLAYGGNGGVNTGVDLFTAEGRLVQHLAPTDRVPFSASWAPDSRHVAVGMGLLSSRGESTEPDAVVWLLDGQGVVELAPGKQTVIAGFSHAGGWSPDGRLALGVYHDRDGNNRTIEVDQREIWTVNGQGSDERKLAEGDYFPVGWSRDGAALFAVGGFERDANGQSISGPSQLIAIDDRTGERRTLTTTDDIARQLQPQSGGPASRLHLYAQPALSPTGDDRIALWLQPETERGEIGATEAVSLAILDGSGQLLYQGRGVPGASPAFTAWSPDGTRLAYTYRSGPRGGGIQVVAVAGATEPFEPVTFDGVNASSVGLYSLHWSPDGRWVAFTREGGLQIAAADAPARVWSLGPSNDLPNWRPLGGP